MPRLRAERALDLLALVQAQQPGVDEDARELVADRAVHQRRRDRRVHAAGQPADHARVADLRADLRDLVVDERARRPVGVAWQTPNRKFAIISPPRGVCATSGWNCTP